MEKIKKLTLLSQRVEIEFSRETSSFIVKTFNTSYPYNQTGRFTSGSLENAISACERELEKQKGTNSDETTRTT